MAAKITRLPASNVAIGRDHHARRIDRAIAHADQMHRWHHHTRELTALQISLLSCNPLGRRGGEVQ